MSRGLTDDVFVVFFVCLFVCFGGGGGVHSSSLFGVLEDSFVCQHKEQAGRGVGGGRIFLFFCSSFGSVSSCTENPTFHSNLFQFSFFF